MVDFGKLPWDFRTFFLIADACQMGLKFGKFDTGFVIIDPKPHPRPPRVSIFKAPNKRDINFDQKNEKNIGRKEMIFEYQIF